MAVRITLQLLLVLRMILHACLVCTEEEKAQYTARYGTARQGTAPRGAELQYVLLDVRTTERIVPACRCMVLQYTYEYRYVAQHQ